jgi:uncharacterized protein (DUF1499 family)
VTRLARGAAVLGLAVGIVAVLALLIAGPGHRFGLWSFQSGFAILRVAVFAGLGAALLSAAGLILAPRQGRRRGMLQALAGLILGLVAAGVPASWLHTARSVPPIHDITTDPADPPVFDAVLALRADAANPAEYGGAPVAAQQAEAYPDIMPLEVAAPPQRAFDAALAAAEAQGWEIVAAAAEAGRIEASERTFWFGFTDDVVIRIRAAGDGSRIDVRSTSRVGVGDMGTNAARIRAYLDDLRDRLG